jgi:hypothetical protein
MNQRHNYKLLQRFDQYQASKTVLFWACAGSVILAIVVGFSWGGWVTGGSAREMAEKSAAQARQELAAVVCQPLRGRAGRAHPAGWAEGDD